MPRVAVVMTYFNRQRQLIRTLRSFNKYDPDDFEVIIVDDGSTDREKLILPRFEFDIRIIRITNKSWIQGDPAWNIGFAQALKHDPEIIMLQNAECVHSGDVLGYAIDTLTERKYISFGCYSLRAGDPFRVLNMRHVDYDGDNAWYNHPDIWPCGYHFCSAITTENLIKLNGFDERFRNGIGYDDDDFLRRVVNLGLNVEITYDPIVFHQWHKPSVYNETASMNRDLYLELCKNKEIKAVHEVTNDLCRVAQ